MYRIGQLAHLAHVSKRTIDYYTNLGILKAERSQSNYRYYDETAFETLQFIEKCKEMHMPLCEIKERVEEKKKLLGVNEHVSKQVNEVTEHIHRLETELTQLKPLLDGLTASQREKISKSLSGQTTALMQALSMFV
ncbi:MerR family transcriptional regulator [Bacillus pseudomycoides]|uniref:MerR family transcriptional regulator n=1 Tax=Bacillus pseudomycoides TaxID=64104 RepID=A0AA91VB76_9BACI|nr:MULTISPECIES: MerR family transcriptional regulator [Bacillus]PEB51889.1 MerR family transcriptional regulator [Bacillus sp. AFS098217]PED81824.1 MerR family transcriptional regulator [Bacillus pseudomycoides]PEU15252.1 MerR family transcriptional regulator [Bacillus sp. AFS014408]PEU17855.1 MerR family transcriptional regulator [Bacillus sp. AFS019443]PFW63348.1 MerR family transcriptional regulator [Bacillus sp. AFS075034]